MGKFLVTLVFSFIAFYVSAQEFSNRGKDFWVGYGYHQAMAGNNTQDMVLYFTSDVAANVTVEIPGIGWTRTYSVNANVVKESDFIPKSGSQDATLKAEGVFNKGIHITSDQPIVAYAHIFNSSVSGATLLFPVNTLGQDYYSLNYTQKSNSDNSNSWCFVIATEDSTTVEITPSASTLNHTAGVPFNILLNKGQIFNLMGQINNSDDTGVDLTGTRLRSVSNGANSCKKIAVFSGAGRMSIFCSGITPTSSDNFIQQVFPKVAWGKKYLTAPTSGLTNNIFRIAVSDPSTVVSLDGVVQTGLVNGFYYEFSANTPKSITSDKPVMVAQYITSTNTVNNSTCGNTYNQNGDPEMIYISPIEQTIDTITVFSTPRYQITEHHINVVIKTADKNSFTLDGASQAAAFATHPKDGNYSYASFTVNQGQHKLQAAGGFNAIAYGYGKNESYGYNAGTNIKDLYTFISLQNQFNTLTVPSTCVNTNFLLAITFPYQPTSITWDFSGAAASLSPNSNVTVNSPVPDSSFIRDGRTLYVYKIPGSYTFTAVGNFPIKIISVNPTADGCSGQQELIYNVQVGAQPIADFSYSHIGCYSDSAYFKDASNGNGRTIVKWQWDFGDATTDSRQNPGKQYAAPNTYNVKLTSINNIGCSNTITKPVIIFPQPVAKFGVTSPACAGTTVKFTDTSSITTGSIVKWRWGFGPGDSVINSTNAVVSRVYNIAGTYTVTLEVENSEGCKSVVVPKQFIVSALPVPDFNMPGVCLPTGNAQFTNLSTISGGTVNSMTYVWNFGDGGSSANQNPVHVYTSAGPFTVKLTATSASGCIKDSSKTFTNIYAQPKAGFKFTPAIACAGDSLIFSDTTKTPNSTVNQWYWSFSDGTSSNIKSPVKKFPGLDTVVVKLSIQTSAGCFSDTAKKIIPFNKLPKAAFNITGTTCQGQTFTLNNQSVANSGVITNWFWYFGNGTSASFSNGNSFTTKYDTAGSYTIKLIVQTDKGCKSDTSNILNIIPAPTVKFAIPMICENDPFAVFTDSSFITGGGALTHLWNFGDVNATPSNPNTSTVVNGQHHFGTAGTYNITLQVGSSTGCTSTASKSFTVNSQPKADFSIANIGTVCGNDSVRIINKSSTQIGNITRLEIIWDSVNRPLVKITDSMPAPGRVYANSYTSLATSVTYKVVLRAYSGQTCMDEKVLPVTIGATPKIKFSPIADFCLSDLSRVITEASETLGVPGTGFYSGVGINSAGLFNPTIAGAGQVNVQYTFTSNNGCKDSASQNIIVVANPLIQLPAQLFVLAGGSAPLNPVITGSATIFNWSPGTYLNTVTAANPVTKPLSNISYKFIASTTGGCSDSANINIVLLVAPKIPNAFSPNGDGVNDLWNIESLSSYPGSTLEVFDRYGNKVFSSIGYSKPWDGTYNGSKLPSGVYYYIVNPKNGRNTFSGNVTIMR